MATTQVLNLGQGGMVKDVPPLILPENIFSEASNVRFNNDSISTIKGEAVHHNATTILPRYGIHWRRPDQGYDIFLQDDRAVRVDAAGNESSVMNLANPAFANSKWDCITFNGGYAIVINNGTSTPKYMLFGDPVAGVSFQDLPGWNYRSGLTITAKVVRQLGYSLVAANLTIVEGSTITNAPSTIRVSVQAPTGGIPQVWQPGVTTDTADEFEINSTSPILDMAELRGNMYVYASDTIHVLSIIGGNSRLQPYAKGYGILNTGCVTEFEGKHFVVDRNDIYVHAGQGKPDSIAEKRVKDYFFDNLNKAQSEKVFVQRNAKYKEVWIFFPKGTSTECNEALIFNYASNTWTTRKVANVLSGFNGFSRADNLFVYSDERMISCLAKGSRVLKMDEGDKLWDPATNTLVDMIGYVAREKLNSGDTSMSTHVSAITPFFDQVPEGNTLSITVTSQNNYTKPADFSNTSGRDTVTIDPNDESQGYIVHPRVSGRVLNYKISGIAPWRLSILGLETQPNSRR